MKMNFQDLVKIATIVLFLVLLTVQGFGQTWVQLSPIGEPPAPRNDTVVAVYDPSSNRLITFGGITYCCTNFNDVWILTNANGVGGVPEWIKLSPAGPQGFPAPRGRHSAVYDPSNNRMIIFGGGNFTGDPSCNFCIFNPLFNDVWVLTNANGLGGTPTWVPLFPDGGSPAGRAGHHAIYDPASNRMTIFGGGNNGIMVVPNDVWVLTNANGLGGNPAWVQLDPTGQIPPPVEAFAIGYDSVNNIMIIFGGCCSFTNATYTLTNANGLGGTPQWTQLTVSDPIPSVRGTLLYGYNPSQNSLAIFGEGAFGGVVHDTWVLNNANGIGTANWVNTISAGAPGTPPVPDTMVGGTYDDIHDRLILIRSDSTNAAITGLEVWILPVARCTINVTPESQSNPDWCGDPYDNSDSLTIQEKGCALTSLSMALNFAGTSNTPGSLNRFMQATDTDYDGLGVNWGPATRDASGGTLKFNSRRIDSAVDLQGATQYLDNVLCQLHHPVIVGVNLDDQRTPQHFVLVTGKQGSEYTIADPGFTSKMKLSQYDNDFVTRGFVADPPGDISELDLAIGDAAEILVIDPSDRKTGFDPTLGQVVEQIPNSTYFRDSLKNDVSSNPPTETTHLAEIFQPVQGSYQIVVSGLKLGTYSLSSRIFSQDGGSQPDVLIQGIAGNGSTSSFSVQLASTPGAISNVTMLATFASTELDIDNSLQLGLIDNHGIAKSLLGKIQAAQKANRSSRQNILNAFIDEINAQADKHITGVAVQVLLADAYSLSTQ